VKFCPFLPKDAPPIFAFTSGPNIFIARVTPGSAQPFSIIHAIEDADDGQDLGSRTEDNYQNHNSLAWMRDTKTGDPLLLFSGIVSKIHVYNVAKHQYVKTLTGHGSAIQEIVPHPIAPSIFATCSDDNEVRLWNLDSRFEDSWCAVICHGEFGHASTVYSIAFSKNGRYLMSGGRDTWVHLWALPDPLELAQLPLEKAKSKRIYYPHFSSAQVHSDIVDCIRFHGDVIASRSVGYKITVWAIDGFCSEDDIPDPPTRRTTGKLTTSAFGQGFMVLYTLNYMSGDVRGVYYDRFNIFPSTTGNPIIAMGDLGEPTLCFWDLARFEKDKGESGFEGDPLDVVQPHEKFSPTLNTATKEQFGFFRALDWSSDGKWLVAGYDRGNLLICWR
jgi:polycomb protein EED